MNVLRRPAARAASSACLAASLAAAFLAAPAARAQQSALGFVPGAFGFENDANDSGINSYTLGFTFTVTRPIAVTALGFFTDPGFDPSIDPAARDFVTLSPAPTGSRAFAQSHAVGIYQVIPATGQTAETGVLLFSANVTNAGTQTGDFRYAAPALAPSAPAGVGFVLLPGATYAISAVTGPTDPYVYDVQTYDQATGTSGVGLTVASPVVYGQDRFEVGSSLSVYPSSTNPDDAPGFFGPNFQFVATPEPPQGAALALGGLGLTGLTLRARRRRG